MICFGKIFLATSLGVIVAIFGAGVIGVAIVTHRVKKFNKQMFGTKKIPIKDAFAGFREGLDDTDMSPKSVSGMTNMMLPTIMRDFPDFNYEEMKEKAKNVLFSFLQAIDERHASILSEGTSELRRILSDRIQKNSVDRQHEHYKEVKLHRMEISRYDKRAGRCTITFQAAIQSYHYITDEEDASKVKKGSKERYEQSKYEVDMIYIQDRDVVENSDEDGFALTCPQCGAPLKMLGAKVCQYCGSPIVAFNIKTWEFSRCEQVE